MFLFWKLWSKNENYTFPKKAPNDLKFSHVVGMAKTKISTEKKVKKKYVKKFYIVIILVFSLFIFDNNTSQNA